MTAAFVSVVVVPKPAGLVLDVETKYSYVVGDGVNAFQLIVAELVVIFVVTRPLGGGHSGIENVYVNPLDGKITLFIKIEPAASTL